ncbi:MAG: GTPase ObgE [Solirubrobacterales bacterium]
MLLDRAKIYVEGGRGGDGEVSFRREAHVPRGGPDGGDGGRGGDVVLVCAAGRRDLGSMGRTRHFRAERGGRGKGARKHGARGEDVEIPVPAGTVAVGLDGAEHELIADGARVVVASGGVGGHGNKRFAGPTRQAPRFAEKGLEGDSGWIELRLKLLADAGLIGLPNAGKSSLLAALTRATPKVGDYPFTTLEPSLGTIQVDDSQLVLADIPGLIEGAADGAGLGHEFLAHIERCRLLVHLVDISDPEAGTAYETIRSELTGYGAALDQLPYIVALSKADLVPADEADEALGEWRDRLGERAATVVSISSVTGFGLDRLRREVLSLYSSAARVGDAAPGRGPTRAGAPAPAPSSADEFESEHRVYRPGEDEGFDVERLGEHRFQLKGKGIELLFARHDTGNPEAMAYVEQRLREIGVLAELSRAGFESGDDVVIGELEMELHTS